MKEIRTIKMVEQTEVKFIAEDGKEFIGEHAENECATYERRINREKVVDAFNRLDAKILDVSFVQMWYGDYARMWQVTLNSKKDYFTLIDYLIIDQGIYSGDCDIPEPKEYPCTMRIAAGCEWACAYNGDLKQELQDILAQLD